MVWLYNRFCRSKTTGSLAFTGAVLVSILVMVSCSGNLNPIFPGQQTSAPALSADSTEAGRMLWGYYQMSINADHTAIEIQPLRNVVMHFNALNQLQIYDPASVSVTELTINPDESLTAGIQLTHPMEGMTAYTAFDIRGIVMLPATLEWPAHLLTTPGVNLGEPAMLNAQGYTRRWNPTEFSEGIAPYNYFDGLLIPPGLGANADAIVNPYLNFYTNADRHHFEAGSLQIQLYHLSFPPGPMIFGYAIDASWDEHIVDDKYNTDFTVDDPLLSSWKAEDEVGLSSDYWVCDSVQGSMNVRDELCGSYGEVDTVAILYSPKFNIPANTSAISMFLKHSIMLDEENEMDWCGVFVTPDKSINQPIQIEAIDHAYELIEDPTTGFSWWIDDHIDPALDEFDLSPALSSMTGFNFHIAFAFVTIDGDDGTNEGGWSLDEMRIFDENAPPTNVPGSFPMSANSMEPYNISVAGQEGQLECSIGEWAGGYVTLSVAVSDWQGDAYVGLENVALEAPDLFDGKIHPWSGTEDGNTFTYEFAISNTKMTEPGIFPLLFSVSIPDEDINWLPEDPIAAYNVFQLDVVEVMPPFCYGNPSIHHEWGGSWQMLGSPGTIHRDCAFLPAFVGGTGQLLYDGGISGSTQHIMFSDIDGDGGDVTANALISITGDDAGNALVVQTNDFNGHALIVTDTDPDNLLVYETTGTLLKTYELGNGENGINEPVCLTTDPLNGDIWMIGDKGNQGIHLERWAYIEQGPTFEYLADPSATVDLSDYLGTNPRPLGIAFNRNYHYLYLYHGRFYGSIDVFDISQLPLVYVEDLSVSNLFGEPLDLTQVPGHRKYIGADIAVDRVDGELEARCRILAFANLESGGSTLLKLDAWCQKNGIALLGSPFACMALNNLPAPESRSLVFFPMVPAMSYAIFLPPDGW